MFCTLFGGQCTLYPWRTSHSGARGHMWLAAAAWHRESGFPQRSATSRKLHQHPNGRVQLPGGQPPIWLLECGRGGQDGSTATSTRSFPGAEAGGLTPHCQVLSPGGSRGLLPALGGGRREADCSAVCWRGLPCLSVLLLWVVTRACVWEQAAALVLPHRAVNSGSHCRVALIG